MIRRDGWGITPLTIEEFLSAGFDSLSSASVEAMMAQRMAELEQIAKYRREQIQLYKDWSKNPEVAREKIMARTQAAGDAIVKDQEGFKPYDFKGFAEKTSKKELHKPQPAKLSLLARILRKLLPKDDGAY